MLGSSKNTLALDVGHFSVKSIQGKFKNNARFNGKIGNYVLKQDAQDKDQPIGSDIHHSLMSIHAKKSIIYTSIQLADAIMREVTVSKDLSAFEIESAIEVELSDALPFSIDQIYFDFQKLKTVESTSDEDHYLVAATRREEIDQLVSKIHSQNKTADIAVDIDAYALGRLISHLYVESLENKLILLIDVAHEHSRFYFYDNENLLFHREQQIGGKYATETISEIYDLGFEDAQTLKHGKDQDNEFSELVVRPFANAFAEQLNLVIDFFEASAKSDKEIDKVVMIGGGACLKGLTSELESFIEKPVELIDLSLVWPGMNPEDGDPGHFSAHYALSLSLLFNGSK